MQQVYKSNNYNLCLQLIIAYRFNAALMVTRALEDSEPSQFFSMASSASETEPSRTTWILYKIEVKNVSRIMIKSKKLVESTVLIKLFKIKVN